MQTVVYISWWTTSYVNVFENSAFKLLCKKKNSWPLKQKYPWYNFQKDLLKFCGLMCTLSKNQGFTNISSFLLIIFDLRAMSHLIFNLTKQRERERDTETDRETERDWSLTHVNSIVL